jgi:Uma2 family endonuclease
MPLPRELLPSYTYEDYKNWEGRWELIEGIPFALASPTFLHQRVAAKLIRFIDEALEKGCENCAVVPDTDYIVNEQTVLRPNIAVVCNNEGEKIVVTPKIVFEIVSKSTARNDEIVKKKIYETEGVEYYVPVYPEWKKAKIYRLKGNKYLKIKDLSGETFTFSFEGCEFSLDFKKIWEV